MIDFRYVTAVDLQPAKHCSSAAFLPSNQSRMLIDIILVSFKTGGIAGYISICDAKIVHLYVYMLCIYSMPMYANNVCKYCSLMHL